MSFTVVNASWLKDTGLIRVVVGYLNNSEGTVGKSDFNAIIRQSFTFPSFDETKISEAVSRDTLVLLKTGKIQFYCTAIFG
jgi:hypothetical protein